MSVADGGELFAALGAGDGDALLDTIEDDWIDFKREPYVLDQPSQPLELAKDIAGLANSGGGVLVLGVETEPDPTSGRDKAMKLRPVRLDLVDEDRYRQTVENWTHPPIRTLQFHRWLVNDGSGIMTISVKVARALEYPVLVTRVDDSTTGRRILLAIPQRVGGRVPMLIPGELSHGFR